MEWRKNRERAFVLAIVLLASLIVYPGTASATSTYDSVYQTTPTLKLGNSSSGTTGYCEEVDYTTSWITLFNSVSNFSSGQRDEIQTTLKNSIHAAVNGDGRWGVSQQDDGASKRIIVFWTENDSLWLDWKYDDQIIPKGDAGLFHSVTFTTQAYWMGNSDCDVWA